MKKVIIISYFFPPSNFVAAARTYSWAKYLNEHGIYPIVVTRQWNEDQRDIVSKVENNVFEHEKYEGFEVYRMPHKRSMRDKLSERRFLKPLQKAYTLKEVIFANYFLSAIPHANFYDQCVSILKDTPDVKAVIASGRPFHSFFIGSKLKSKFPNIAWIPDYRDEWNSHQNPGNLGYPELFNRLITSLERKSEKRWTKNADFFLTTSDYWVKSIGGFINKPGKVVMNGFDESQVKKVPSNTDDRLLKITYAGTLYHNQPIELFVESCVSLLEDGVDDLRIEFIGINMIPDQKTRIEALTEKFPNHFNIIDRLSKEALSEQLATADCMMLTGFNDVKGWYPVKLFDYCLQEKPAILCPSDNDVIENFMHETKAGYIANTLDECKKIIMNMLEQKRSGIPIHAPLLNDRIQKYSRRHQAKILAKILNEELS